MPFPCPPPRIWRKLYISGYSRIGRIYMGDEPVKEILLSPCLFLLLMDVLTEDVRKDLPGSMTFADDIVLCGDDETDMTEYFETWRRALEDRGMRISRPKTQFMDFNLGQDNGQEREPVKTLGEELQSVHHFKYLGSSVEETGCMATQFTECKWRMEKLEEMQRSVE